MSVLFPKLHTYKIVSLSYVRGVATESTIEATFVGDIQPMSGKEVQALNINRRTRGMVKVYSNAVFNVSTDGELTTPGDIIVWEGAEWEVIQEMRNVNDLISHYKYIAEYRNDI